MLKTSLLNDSALIKQWLLERDPEQLKKLWDAANLVRHETMGDEVHLRGVVEISNRCVRHCLYCGINAHQLNLARYEMNRAEIIHAVEHVSRSGAQTIVLQSGENPDLDVYGIAEIILYIKANTELKVTLSLGEKSEAILALWKQAGADRYLLKFETSNQALYAHTHQGSRNAWKQRLATLTTLKRLGYQIGSGVILGLPGQTTEDLVQDLLLIKELELDMIACGPYQETHDLPFNADPASDQVSNSHLQTHICNALIRIMNPHAQIPATAALAANDGEDARWVGLNRGCNVIMPNFTPPEYRERYQIYPSQLRAVGVSGEALVSKIQEQLNQMGRPAVMNQAPPQYSDPRGQIL